MAQEEVYTGNEVKVVINGVEVELVQTIRMSQGFGHEPISGIGEINPRGHAPTAARYTATISKLAMPKEQAVQAGFIYKNGAVALAGQTFDVEVFKKNGPLIKKILGCVNDSSDIAFTAHRMVMLDGTFMGINSDGDIATAA